MLEALREIFIVSLLEPSDILASNQIIRQLLRSVALYQNVIENESTSTHMGLQLSGSLLHF